MSLDNAQSEVELELKEFSTMVDDMDMPDITKFLYQCSLLDGGAKATVEGLTLLLNLIIRQCVTY